MSARAKNRSMSGPPKKPAVYADIEALPEHLLGEIVDGELYVSPRPAILHAVAASVLGGQLVGPFQLGRGGPGGWLILDEPELHFGADVLVPDLAGWRQGRLPDALKLKFVTIAPDWICEVLSPATGRLDRVKKLRIYARQGVEHAWLIDPELRTLEVFAREDKRWLLLDVFSDADRVHAPPFADVELELASLWREKANEK